MYLTRRIKIDATPELDELRRVAGDVWNEVVTKFWRTVRRQGHWLSKYALQRWVCKSDKFPGLQSHSIQAVNHQFFEALSSWRTQRKQNSNLRPPHKQKKYNRVMWRTSAIRIQNGQLKLSRGRGYSPLIVEWGDKPKPKQAELIYDQGYYYLCCQYKVKPKDQTTGNEVAGIDLGEIHLAAVDDGEKSFLFNGRELRSKRRYQSKLKSKFQKMLSRKQKGSNSWNRLVESKRKQLKKIQNQIRDILHQTSRKLVDTCLERDVSTLVIGDLKGIRQNLNYGSKVNQK